MTPRCYWCAVEKPHPWHNNGTPNLPVDPSLLCKVWHHGQWVSWVEANSGR